MSITREQVADLREGDVVELTDIAWGEGVALRGPLRMSGDKLMLGYWTVRYGDGGASESHTATLTVVSRTPRPLYVNHDRTEPVPGDVVRNADGNDGVTWMLADTDRRPWISPALETWVKQEELPTRLRLLVDGATGQVVPS